MARVDSGGGGTEERVTAALGAWRPPEAYNQPHLEPEGSIRTAEHEVLDDVSVVQNIGENAETFTLRGDAYAEDISELRNLKGDVVMLRHPIHSGDVLIEGVSASHTGSYDKVDGEERWVYTYTLSLIESV